MTDAPLPSPDALRARLEALRSRRGYLLAHHGALAAAAPDLHQAYLTMYEALTLARRHLDPFEKEFVWLAVLTCEKEAIGTHHLRLFAEAGGTADQATTAFRLAGYAGAADAFSFVETHWRDFFPALEAPAAYLEGLSSLTGGSVASETVHLALLAVHAVRASRWGVTTHLREAYRCGIPEHKLVEALSLVIWPAGVNRFYEACAIWHELMAAGEIAPSPLYRAWAETPAGPFARSAAGSRNRVVPDRDGASPQAAGKPSSR